MAVFFYHPKVTWHDIHVIPSTCYNNLISDNLKKNCNEILLILLSLAIKVTDIFLS